MIEDNKFDNFEVHLPNPIEVKAGYIVLQDPQLVCSEILKKITEAFKVRIRIRTTDSKEGLSPFITNSFSQWREEFLEKLLKALSGHIKQQKEQTVHDFAVTIDKEIFVCFQQGLQSSYQRYCVAERNNYRTIENAEYEIIVNSDDEDNGFSEPEQKVLDGCAEWLLKVDTTFDLLSRCYVYGIINEQKAIACEVTKKRLYEKWSPNGDEANFKAVLKVVQRFMIETSDARFLSMLRLKSDLENKSPGVTAAAALVGSELFSVIIERHNPGKSPEKDLQVLRLIQKLNRDFEQHIKVISALIIKFLGYDSTFELQKSIEIRNELVRIFEKIFSGEASIENEQWQIEKIGEDKPMSVSSKVRGDEDNKEVEFKIDLVALSNSMYLNTK